jgi:outer membrane protein TolC
LVNELIKKIILIPAILYNLTFAQQNLNYFIQKAEENSPALKEYSNLISISSLEYKLNEAQISAFQVYLTSDFLFAPYFNNNGHFISTNPDPKAIGYDVGITNGGLYSALINVDKNIFNDGLLNALQEQKNVSQMSSRNNILLEKHNLQKSVTDQYLTVIQSYQQVNLSKDIVNNIQQQLKISEGLVEQGYLTASDYLLLKIELKNQLRDLNSLRQQFKTDLYNLFSICGIKDTSIVKLDTVSLTISQTDSSSRFLRQYYLDSLSTEIQQHLFETKYQPQVKLFFNTGLNAVEIDNIQRRFGFSAGIDFSIPILDGGQRDITRQQSILRMNTISDFKNYSKNNIEKSLIDSKKNIVSLRKNLEDLKEQIKDYSRVMDITYKELQNGSISMVDYLTLLRNFIDLKKNKITTEINYQMEINNYNYWNW